MSFSINNPQGASAAYSSDHTEKKSTSKTLSSNADKSITSEKKIKSSSASKKPEKSGTSLKATFKAYAMQQLQIGSHSTKKAKNQALECEFADPKKNDNLSKLVEDIENQSEQKDVRYGGNLGNDYFSSYKKDIIMPALIIHFKQLKSIPKGKLNKESSFATYSKLITDLGKHRKEIAETTKTDRSGMFGAEFLGLTEVLSPEVFTAWYEHIKDHLSLNELFNNEEFLKLEDGEKVNKLIEVLEQSPFLKDSVITQDYNKPYSFIYITPKDITIAPYKIVIKGREP